MSGEKFIYRRFRPRLLDKLQFDGNKETDEKLLGDIGIEPRGNVLSTGQNGLFIWKSDFDSRDEAIVIVALSETYTKLELGKWFAGIAIRGAVEEAEHPLIGFVDAAEYAVPSRGEDRAHDAIEFTYSLARSS